VPHDILAKSAKTGAKNAKTNINRIRNTKIIKKDF